MADHVQVAELGSGARVLERCIESFSAGLSIEPVVEGEGSSRSFGSSPPSSCLEPKILLKMLNPGSPYMK